MLTIKQQWNAKKMKEDIAILLIAAIDNLANVIAQQSGLQQPEQQPEQQPVQPEQAPVKPTVPCHATVDEVKKALMDFTRSANGSKEKAMELMAEFGAKKVSDVPADNRNRLIANLMKEQAK